MSTTTSTALPAKRRGLWFLTIFSAITGTIALGLWFLFKHLVFGWNGDADWTDMLWLTFFVYIIGYRGGRSDANKESDRVIRAFIERSQGRP